MDKKPLTEFSIKHMEILMLDKVIAEKIQSAAAEGKSYALCEIKEDGRVILGETRFDFWNRLIGCRTTLQFESWALAVWDALVCLSKDGNAVAIEEGLSVEIAKKAQRDGDYNWVVDRLVDIYRHVCNNKDGGAPLEGGRRKSGSSVVVGNVAEPVVVNVNVADKRRVFRFPDATGKAFLNVETGIVGMSAELH